MQFFTIGIEIFAHIQFRIGLDCGINCGFNNDGLNIVLHQIRQLLGNPINRKLARRHKIRSRNTGWCSNGILGIIGRDKVFLGHGVDDQFGAGSGGIRVS